MKTNFTLISFVIGSVLFAFGGSVIAQERTVSYTLPDIRNDFCGVEINHQFCKCAFHNEFCKAVGQTKESAEIFVNSEFQSWVKENIKNFALSCVDNKGLYDKGNRSCTYCDGGSWENGRCVENSAELIGPYGPNCSLSNEFTDEWEKYSDFDSRISVRDASYEVGQYNEVLDTIASRIALVEQLEYEMELDRLFRLEMREYKKAIVQNLRANLTKSIIRLSWMTYNTVKGSKGAGESYSNIFTSDSTVTQIAAAVKFVQAGVPKGSKAEIDTNSRIGKIKSGAWNATLEAFESGGDPKAIAMQVYKDSAAATVNAPSLNFTDEEIGILREQYLENNALDELIADSYKENALRRREIQFLSKEIEELYVELQDWKQKEFERVSQNLVDQCKTGGR